jgi:hypothetical protein
LHFDSKSGALRVAVIKSILETCRRPKLDIREYMRDVLPNFPTGRRN